MAVHIFDADVLERLTLVEGPDWAEQQARSADSPYSLAAWIHAWQERAGAGAALADVALREMVGSGDGAIYGAGGFSRYVVRDDSGEVVLLGWSARADKREAAERAGITIAAPAASRFGVSVAQDCDSRDTEGFPCRTARAVQAPAGRPTWRSAAGHGPPVPR